MKKDINEVTLEVIEQFPSIRMESKLDERLKERGITLMELSLLTGIRYATLIDFKKGDKLAIHMKHMLAIMIVLRLEHVTDLFDTTFDDDTEENRYGREVYDYKNNGIPEHVLDKMPENAKRLGREKDLRGKYKKSIGN